MSARATTFKEYIGQFLDERGMFLSDADAVTEIVINDPANAAMRDRWDEPIENYPPAMVTHLHLAINASALEYIEKHCPNAWFKPLFQQSDTRRQD